MKPFVRTLRVVNPHKRKRSRPRKSRARKTRRNPGELILLTNPYRGGGVSKMSKSRKRRSSRRRKSNPMVKSHRRSSRRHFARRRSNPSLGGYSLATLAKLGVGTAVGAIATRQITSTILSPTTNTGWQGYLANIAVALGLGYAGSKFISKEVGLALATGGVAAVAVRVYGDKFGPNAGILSGLGDDTFLGAFVDTGFALPSVSTQSNGNYVVSAPGGASPAGLAAGGSSAPAVSVARFASRYAN